MDVRLLGPVEASVDGRAVAVGAGKPRALLAMLALNAGSTVSSDRLIDGLWGDPPPATAAKLVQLHVSQLRKALAAAGNGKQIVTRGHGYELRLGPEELDLTRFQRLVAGGRPREALALWRGPALDDVGDEPFATAEIRRLEELRLAAVELAIERDLDAGRHREVTGELEALVLDEPLRERLHAQRMLALYRCGRQADALDAYRQARGALVERVGVEPGPELRRLHEAILRQDPALDPPAVHPSDLPPELDTSTPLVGREAELDRLHEHWRLARSGAGRLVLVTGARGMGKMRLAGELAAVVRCDGGAVHYVAGDGGAIRVPAGKRPTLLVLDEADRAGAALAELLAGAAALPLLVLATAEHATFATGLGAADTLTLAPLGAEGVRAVARLHAGAREDQEIPVVQLQHASGGVPRELHRAAREWARSLAVRRLGDAAGRIAAERPVLRAAEDDLAGSILALAAGRERDEPAHDDADADVLCPFKGLASFDVADARFFFGRERLVGELVARLIGAPLTGIVGPSGSGKSSALRAGLLAALSAGVLPGSERWPIALLRPGERPVRSLGQAIADAAPEGRLIVAVDQFEEVFTACRDEDERAAFAGALTACARDPRRRPLVLVALRADFYGRCAAYPELSRLLGANHVLVGPMSRDELRRAIELPASQAGLEVEPELVGSLLADVEGEPGALPLLSTALLELWQHRDGGRLRHSAYEHAGGVHGAVARLAERAYERLDPESRQIARRILLRLAGEGDGDAVVRRRVPLVDLEDAGVAEVLSALADDRLVTIGKGEVEVAHEALLREWPRLRGWLEEDAEGRRLHQHVIHAARDWEASGRDPAELYRGARLAAALEWSAAHAGELNATEREFVAASRTASERSHRRLRALLAGLVALLALAVVAGAVALEQRGNARAEATAAEAQRLGSRALVENDLDRSLLLARQGVALDDTVQTRGNLLAALVKSPAAVGVMRGDGDGMWTVGLSPDERTLAAGDPSGNVFLFDTRTRRRIAVFRPGDGLSWIVQLVYSPDGSRLAVGHDSRRGNVVTVFDSRSHAPLLRIRPPAHRLVTALRYSADGTTLDAIAAPKDPEGGPTLLIRYDARTGRRVLGPEPINDREGSPLLATSDGTQLVTAGKGEVAVRDAATLRTSERFAVGGPASAWPAAYALGPNDPTLAIGDESGSVRFLDLRTGALRSASGRHGAAVAAALFTPDGRTLISTSEDGDVIVWDVEQGTAVETLSGHGSGIYGAQITSDGRTLYTSSLDGTVFVWDLSGSRRLGRRFTAGAGGGYNVAQSSDGRLLATGQEDGALSIVDARTLKPRATHPVGGANKVSFVPGSHLVVAVGDDAFAALVDADSGRVIRRLRGHHGDVKLPGISADGRLLTTGDTEGVVRFWSLPDGAGLGMLRFGREIFSSQLSPDGRWLSVSLVDAGLDAGNVELWDVRTRRRVRSLRFAEHPGTTRFSPDSRMLAIGNRNGRTRVWSTQSWRPVTRSLEGDAGGIQAAEISPDGRTVVTGNEAGAVRLWDIETQQSVGAPLPGAAGEPVVPSFTADGTGLIAAYATGDAYRWDIRPDSLVRHACQVAGRRLTRAEWQEFLPTRDYAPAC
jgi:WD40 repeat protein/DNA-binding SARP family transcriptional activator